MTDHAFDPPGPGTWNLNKRHFPRPLSRYFQSFYPAAFTEGLNGAAARYGFPFEFDVEVVNGYWYTRRRPVGDPSASGDADPEALPPATLRGRAEQAAKTFEARRWRADLERWDGEWKPALREANQSLLAVEPPELDDQGLVDHLNECREAAWNAAVKHHRMTPCGLVPFGDFVDHVLGHTDRSPAEIVRLMDGASPDSVDAVADLQPLARAIEANPEARELLEADLEPATIIDRLRSRDDEVGAAMEDWLAVAGYRLASGYDIADVYGLERPSLLVSTLLTVVEDDTGSRRDTEDAERVDAIRQSFPPEHRETFDERLEETRLTYRTRDERSLLDNWTLGLTRRALLEAGRRLVERGRLRHADHVVDLEHSEVVAALEGGAGPSAAEVAVHARYRTGHDSTDAPDRLGPDPSGPPPLAELPEPLQSVVRAFRSLQTLQGLDDREDAADRRRDALVSGSAASSGRFEGRARVVSDPADFDRIRDGDVLVAEATSSAFNVILPLLGAIVTDFGGTLSHPALVAREFGIPAVVGCEDATARIEDGDRILVDGDEGTVRLAR